MIDFDKLKPIQKSKEEQAFDELNVKYTEQFGTPYVFDFAESMTWAETLADIRRRIAENDPQKPPEYIPGANY